ncbi:unnamed protein product, partial [Mesorhabditis spiculigera]
MATAGTEIELVVCVVEGCLLVPTLLCVLRFPLRSDTFSRFALFVLLLPELMQLLSRIVINFSGNYRPSTLLVLSCLRTGAGLSLLLSTLLVVVCSFHHLLTLDYKGSRINKILCLLVLLINLCVLGFALYAAFDLTVMAQTYASIFAFAENLTLALVAAAILFRTHQKRAQFAERRRGPNAKLLFGQTVAYARWQCAVYFITFEYFVFFPGYKGAEYVETSAKVPDAWSPYPFGTLWAFVCLMRGPLSVAGIWLWHPAFRYDLRRALRHKNTKAANTITISSDFSDRNQPIPVGDTREPSQHRLSVHPEQYTKRNKPQVVKGPFAQIERQQQRLGTSYITRR